MKKQKRYFYSVVEEGVMNPAYFGYAGGRIEVTDTKSKSAYPKYEARFLIPEELMPGFRDWIDFKSSNKKIFIRWDDGLSLNEVKKNV